MNGVSEYATSAHPTRHDGGDRCRGRSFGSCRLWLVGQQRLVGQQLAARRAVVLPAAGLAIRGALPKPLFSYMTSSGRLFVPLLFMFRSPEVNNNWAWVGRILPSARRSKTGED